jgi:uncharacterized protein
VGEVTSYPNGTFCWVDLGTTNVEGAKSFYGGLFGWEFEDASGYTTCRLGGKIVTGLHEHSQEEGTHWSSYISVDDVQVATDTAEELGATVTVEPTEIAGTARMSLIRDPSGAQVSLWQPAGFPGATLVNQVGTWTWNELVTPAVGRARDFYGALFGWTSQAVPGRMERASFALGDQLIGAVHAPAPGEGESPRWTVTFRVADVDQIAELVQQRGGTVLLPPMDIPVGRFAIVADPSGAAFTIARAEPFGTLDGS